ncbi:MAG: EF-P lysine aminoacylase GenX [Chloroflexi bacterium]|nr:EF-P lysine aminoacylase GenX [Chloroflexota bacterium]
MNWRLASRRKALVVRAAVLQAIREFFIHRGYLEVETPHRIPAPAPEAHIDAVPADGWFLHTSPELCMKRLLAAGYPRIFQICHCWREGERGSRHIPEFTLLEWYRADSDYQDLMGECETLIQSISSRLGKGDKITYQGKEITLAGPWPRISVEEAFSHYARLSMAQALEQDLFDEILVQDIEPHLGIAQPTFLYDYPAVRGALARLRPDKPSVAERFELYIAGLELANGFSELTDAAEQRARFLHEEAYRRALGKRPYPLPEKFLSELEEMPPSAGIALGVDRLVMLFVDAATIDEVVAFTPEEL